MKVIHFLAELKFSGAEVMYVDAAPLFRRWGVELYVVNTAKELGEFALFFEKAGYKVLHWPYPNGRFGFAARWRYNRKVMDFLRKEHIDVVHIHNSGMKWGMSYCAWRCGCKAIYTYHSVFTSHWYSYGYHWWLRWSAKNLFGCTMQTISDSVYENELQYYHNKTVKVYNWYGGNRFFPAKEEERNSVRKELGIEWNTPVIISVGGCSPIKRHTDVIKALPKVLRQLPDLLYLHLGEGVSLEEEKELAERLGVSGHVRFCGNQRDVRHYLIAADIYVMTSKHEGIPLTTIEAMGTGIPAVLYDVPGLRDFNRESECAVIIPEDVDKLADAIVALYDDRQKQVTLRTRAKEFVDTYFNMETNARRIYELYKGK